MYTIQVAAGVLLERCRERTKIMSRVDFLGQRTGKGTGVPAAW